jgi:hypothetical protein
VEPLPGLGCQAEGQRREVGLIGCHAVKARVWTPAVIQRGLRTPTGPFYARYYTGIILGSVAMFVFMGPSTKRMALFSAALWIVRELIAGWKFRPGCSTGPHVLMNCG